MGYNNLGDTNIQVSKICLGTMTWGEQNTQSQAFSQMDFAVEKGINFFDTAEIYPVPPQRQTFGQTEMIIGNWFKKRGGRSKVVLATKVAGKADFVNYIREGQNCLDRKNMEAALHDSLKRLQTDYIDLYQVHWPDRPTNFFGTLGYKCSQKEDWTPLEETLEVLSEFVESGKVRHVGISNETPWGFSKYLELSKERGWPRIVSIQNPYNLLNRTFEIGLAEFSHREKVGLLAYSPLGFGVLSGKYLDGARPSGARITKWERFGRYTNALGEEATQAYVTLAKTCGLNPAQMALAFVSRRSFVTSTIIGATNMEQLKINIESGELSLSKDLEKAIDKIHLGNPNPCP